MTYKSIEQLKEHLVELEHEDTIVLESPDYLSAIVGLSEDGRLIYNKRKMINWLCKHEELSIEDASLFLEYNTIRALPYMGLKRPIILEEL